MKGPSPAPSVLLLSTLLACSGSALKPTPDGGAGTGGAAGTTGAAGTLGLAGTTGQGGTGGSGTGAAGTGAAGTAAAGTGAAGTTASLCLLAPIPPSRGLWTNRTPAALPTSWPVARRGTAMVADTGINKVVLYGGYANALPAIDTWEWDHSTGTWTEKKVTPPGVFDMAAVAFDSKRARMFLFGGESYPNGGPTNDVWEYDGTLAGWSLLQPVSILARPSKQTNALAAYDPLHRRVLVYGGAYGEVPAVSAWDSVTRAWLKDFGVGPGPTNPERSTFVWDECRDRGVLFGGATGDELWEWNPETFAWTQIPRLTGQPWPAARTQAAFVFDSAVGRSVMFGGRSPSANTTFNDLWQWNGGSWEELGPPPSELRPPPRASAGLVFAPWTERIFVFGGGGADGFDRMDLWEWRRY